MSKVTKNERISTLEDAVAMNWSDMKKIETKISRAMTDMATRISNISLQLEGQQRQIHLAADSIGLNKQAIIMLENKAEPKPQLKQLDQSIFDGLDEKWRFAAVDGCTGRAYVYEQKPHFFHGKDYWRIHEGLQRIIGHDYDTSNWQNSLIERDIAKELTGSEDTNTLSDIISDIVDELLDSEYFYSKITCELLRIGCSYVLAYVSDVSEQDAIKSKEVAVIDSVDVMLNDTDGNDWKYAVPINNQGEPLTAAEAGL